jgi:hypothetical protein
MTRERTYRGGYRAAYLLSEMGGEARCRYEVALRYYTAGGHRSVRYGYAALRRAIRAGVIELRADGSVALREA